MQALVDRKKIVISEEVIHEILQLDYAEGVVCLPNEEIFVDLAQIGYEKPSTKLTFYKAFFFNQWKFLIRKLLQSLSAKRTFWNEFSSAMASAVICLSKDGLGKVSQGLRHLYLRETVDELDKDEGIELVVDQVKDADTAAKPSIPAAALTVTAAYTRRR
nr:hypothetical protein [Tanacetum cinerariifolium]